MRRRLAVLLDDGTGRPAPRLGPLADALCSARNPMSTEAWLRSRPVRERLKSIARGDLARAHEALSALPPSGGVNHLRQLLMSVGLLPLQDTELLKFEQWTKHLLDRIEPAEDRRDLATYIAWHHRRRLRGKLADGSIKPKTWRTAQSQIRTAAKFLAWLRARDTALADCTQHDVDRWFAGGPSTRNYARRFINFAVQRRICGTLRVPYVKHGQPVGVHMYVPSHVRVNAASC
ncbi:hypothetical protein [Embleya scabrispora]|uniref:hypothetical protein n=1 Tax=Embleya scabrispora TaxID=159449 RepID=UPI00037029A5|nr:hypothetical protein [Embleya scabrispora]MYS80034.1 hypothetical protein [Streptomyces sp. SID5474]